MESIRSLSWSNLLRIPLYISPRRLIVLEIHKVDDRRPSVRIDIEEVFPARYTAERRREVCEVEAVALYDALRSTLPSDTKQYLARLITSVDSW
jgi:hypothetical protein